MQGFLRNLGTCLRGLTQKCQKSRGFDVICGIKNGVNSPTSSKEPRLKVGREDLEKKFVALEQICSRMKVTAYYHFALKIAARWRLHLFAFRLLGEE